jgi:hypothetical protein
MDMHPECQKWLEDFQEIVLLAGPTEIYTHLVDMEVGVPNSYFGKLTFVWLYNNKKFYNTAVWKIIQNKKGLFKALRRVATQDLRTQNTKSPEYCMIALRTYNEDLLKNFLLENPNPDWVNVR